jgi:hypothetical protein
MDWEYPFYANNNANANVRPPKAFYIGVLRNGMAEYSPDEVEQCIAAYHAAEGLDTEAEQYMECDGTSVSYPDIGGSSW